MKTTIIGIGRPGREIGQLLVQMNSEVFEMLTVDYRKGPGKHFLLKEVDSYEEYERQGFEKAEQFQTFLGKEERSFLFIFSSSCISAVAAGLMESCGSSERRVIYIRSENFEFYTKKQKESELVLFQGFQNLARLLIIKELFLVDNISIESLVDQNTNLGYYQSLNQIIAHSYYFKRWFEHTQPDLGSSGPVDNVANIVTIGICELEKGEEKSFFPLQNAREKWYYYGVGKNEILNKFELLKKIREQLKNSRKNQMENIKFAIFDMKDILDESTCYFQFRSSTLQEIKRLTGEENE